MLMEFVSKTFEKYMFKTATNNRLLSWNMLSIVFYQQKTSENKMLNQIGTSINDIC